MANLSSARQQLSRIIRECRRALNMSIDALAKECYSTASKVKEICTGAVACTFCRQLIGKMMFVLQLTSDQMFKVTQLLDVIHGTRPLTA